LAVALLGYACGTAAAAVRIAGQVLAGGGPIASSTVTLWAASAGEPKQLAQAKSGGDGRFELRTAETPGKDVVLYAVAMGGVATVKKGSGDNPAIALLTVLGFTGMGLDGDGWGTAVTRDKVWASSFNGKILVMDFNGKPIGTENDFPFKEKFLGLMGIGVSASGDVWIADGSDNQLVYFPGGRVKDGRIVKVDGLKSPFDIVIDDQNRVWVSNSSSDKVVRFPANDPSKVEAIQAGISVRGLALDSKGNVWVASGLSLDFPVR
jgi:hypothetical protein